MKKIVLAVALATALASAGHSASAQQIVYDPTNFTSNLKQVTHMVSQLKKLDDQLSNMRGQLDTAKSQLTSMTGARGMGKLVTDATRDYIPRNWREALAAGGQIGAIAQDIKKTANYLSDQDLSKINPAYKEMLKKSGETAINAMASNTMVFKESAERFDRVQTLMDKIEAADDMKAIADLQARVQVEQVMLQNELLRAQAMNAMIASQKDIDLQRQRQKAAQSFKY